ncbi:transmembrane amino acid transporter [Diplodia corticola]|uniref:Transmembrane amino acid transporter n=1 Tax=Diplodia corticola TaxID=236234 RepID=A0A1J9QQC8_9PEZI|nr:transmembrane amino acid transporter [Diplodia corticola]OJD31134.1 transmembrane amino acid transporter [Diplodia corticola]
MPDQDSQPRPVPVGRASPSDRGRSPAEGSVSRVTSTRRLGSPVPSFGVAGSPRVAQVPTPQQLQAGDVPESRTPLAGLEPGKSSLPGPGESALANALKGSFAGSPPRFGTPPVRAASPVPESLNLPRTNYGSFNSQQVGSPSGRLEDHEIVRRHLVGGGNGSSPNLAGGVYGSPKRGSMRAPDHGRAAGDDEEQANFDSLQLQGGDITRQIYRWTEQQEAEAQGKTRRSRSFHAARPRPEDNPVLNINSIKQPGGFRRNYIRRAAGSPSPGPSDAQNGAAAKRPNPHLLTSNFLEFLSLYGHFAGEELEEDDEVLGPDEYFSSDAYDEGTGGEEDESDGEPGEHSALLTPGKRRKRRRQRNTGKGTPSGAAMLLLKSFVGTGVLFLPRAFLNGGMLFSNLVLLLVSGLSYYCFVLLTTTRLYVHASFGDMGYHLYGKWMRNLINISLVVSQIGFSSAYIVFVSENLQAFVEAVSKCRTFIDIKYMILMQMIIFLPLSLYRNINHIQKLALVADAFIILGLVYLYYYDILTLASQHGISDIKNFNPNDWTLFIGTAIFTFEGIGLIIPIQSSMKDPAKFPRVLAMVMIVITVIFVSMGALSYAAFGSKTKTVIILNMPQDNKFVNGVQFIYSLAILLSTPLQIFPAIEIASQQLFSKTGKFNPWVKWKKNFFRFFMVMCCALIAWVGAGDLDKFVSLVGSFACIPLVYIYPPLLHYRAVSRTFWQRFADISLIVVGMVMMLYTTALTINSWVGGDSTKPPGYCDDK